MNCDGWGINICHHSLICAWNANAYLTWLSIKVETFVSYYIFALRKCISLVFGGYAGPIFGSGFSGKM